MPLLHRDDEPLITAPVYVSEVGKVRAAIDLLVRVLHAPAGPEHAQAARAAFDELLTWAERVPQRVGVFGSLGNRATGHELKRFALFMYLEGFSDPVVFPEIRPLLGKHPVQDPLDIDVLDYLCTWLANRNSVQKWSKETRQRFWRAEASLLAEARARLRRPSARFAKVFVERARLFLPALRTQFQRGHCTPEAELPAAARATPAPVLRKLRCPDAHPESLGFPIEWLDDVVTTPLGHAVPPKDHGCPCAKTVEDAALKEIAKHSNSIESKPTLEGFGEALCKAGLRGFGLGPALYKNLF